MDTLPHEKAIMECLVNFLPPGAEVSRTTDLLQLGIDSINFVRLIVMLEERLEIEIEDNEVLLENFSNVEKIHQVIEKALEAKET
ncbi:phosphopantetheine-binding protein [Brevibacillus fulvus]|uniref:Acyl carrier protein n=1 Tax=Brevibacillus fulvus TaxID=1125967 RepID=A0A939BRJ6_9BACL|nr:phosphopantetheine-binding protein [Brevibacillus fulvus]MBM7589697.1 acyl carrier protein [Brevibacillus fulvus]